MRVYKLKQCKYNIRFCVLLINVLRGMINGGGDDFEEDQFDEGGNRIRKR